MTLENAVKEYYRKNLGFKPYFGDPARVGMAYSYLREYGIGIDVYLDMHDSRLYKEVCSGIVDERVVTPEEVSKLTVMELIWKW